MKKKLPKYLLLILLVNISTTKLISQINNIGYPFIEHYEREEFQAGIQSWMISQAPDGLMYFANNDGLLEFDGQYWNLHYLTEKTIFRSVFADNSGKIYVGGNNNFGYYERNISGVLVFHSLIPLLKAQKKDFEEIWKIYKLNDDIVFQSYKQLIIYKQNKTITIIKAPSLFHFSFVLNNILYIVDKEKGLMTYKKGVLQQLKGTEKIRNYEITSILTYGKNLLICTLDDGIYVYDGEKTVEWENKVSSFLRENQIYCAIRIDADKIAFGTIQNGLLICSNKGEVNLFLNESKGLQNNTILCMFIDKNGNLWLGTDNGIDLVKINSPFRLLNKFNGISAGYTAIVYNNILYLGTNRGVFYMNFNSDSFNFKNDNYFKLIENTKGQVWKLQIIDNQLFCGHNSGTFIISGTSAKKISDIPGVWTFIQIPQQQNKIIAGTYNGLILFEKINNTWQFKSKISGFSQSSRIMLFDKDMTIWMSHGFKGVYHLFLNNNFDKIEKIDFFNKNNGFKTDYGINLTTLKNKIVFLSSDGVYKFNDKNKKMESSEDFNSLFKIQEINYAKENDNNDIWFYSGKKLFVLRYLEDGNYSEIALPFNPLQGMFIGGFEFVYSLSKEKILLGYEKGFIIYNQTFNKNYQAPFKSYFREIKIPSLDSDLISGKLFYQNKNKPKINFKNNGLLFYFSAVELEDPQNLEFSTFLNGYDKTWSDWEKRFDREFTNLHEGNYSFYVKAKNVYGVETPPIIYNFTIKPPLTRTKLAYVIYLFLIIFSLFLLIYSVLKRIEKVKLREEKIQKEKFLELERNMQRETLISEKEIIRLRNEKLRQEMKNKNKELADSTMQTIRKNKFLIHIKTDLMTIHSNITNENVKKNIKSIIRKLDNDINNENNWKVFENHFLNVHEEFLIKFKQAYPEITPSELRLCACLRMNLSSKEIGSLFNISVRGVETSRYRLRKVLNLDRKTNLTDFILSF